MNYSVELHPRYSFDQKANDGTANQDVVIVKSTVQTKFIALFVAVGVCLLRSD